jgi:hypothetical protein
MLELGKGGSAGAGQGELPVLRDGAMVARLKASNWKEQATALIEHREWLFTKHKRELVARRSVDPGGTARLRARQISWWKSTWTVELDGAVLEMRPASKWRGTHRYLAGDRQVAVTGSVGRWSPRPTLTAEDSLPLDHQVFLLWVELVLTRRAAATAAAGVGAVVVAGS